MLKIIKSNNSFPSQLSQSTQTVDQPEMTLSGSEPGLSPTPFLEFSLLCPPHTHSSTALGPNLLWPVPVLGRFQGYRGAEQGPPRGRDSHLPELLRGWREEKQFPYEVTRCLLSPPMKRPRQPHTHKSGHPGTQLEGRGRNMMLHSPFCEKLGRYQIVNAWGPWMRLQVEPIDFETISKLHGMHVWA